MHILISILSALGIIAFLIIRISQAMDAVRHLSDEATGVRGAVRRYLFRKKATAHPLTLIVDPREATLALMVAVMKDKGNLTTEQIEDLEYWAATRLNYTNPKEMVSLARWLVKDSVESGAVLLRVGKMLSLTCNGEQRADIIDLVESAARGRSHHGQKRQPPSELQAHTIQQLKYRFGDVKQQTLTIKPPMHG